MDNILTKQIFDSQFKYAINSELRHRGDFKSLNSDMGLFVISRMIEEQIADGGESTYSRFYICRMIRFSGSGELAKFSENELISVEEYEKKTMEQEMNRKQRHREMEDGINEIFEYFKVSRNDKVYLNKGGMADRSTLYKVSGCQSTQELGLSLTLRPVENGKSLSKESIVVTNPNQFQLAR